MRRLLVLFALGGALPLSAQAPGDSLRVQLRAASEWRAGRLVRSDSGGVLLREGLSDNRYRLAELNRAQVWKRQSPWVPILGAPLATSAGWAIGYVIDSEREPWTGSHGGDLALSAGVGVVIGLIYTQVSPGGWKNVSLGRR